MYQYDSNALTQSKKILNSEHMGEFAHVGEWNIHYYELGEDEDDIPLLLIHGWMQSLYTWRKVIPALAKNRRVIAIDLPGAGYSSRAAAADYSIDNMAELIVRFMDTLAIKACDIVGFSFGAMYVLRAAELHPRRFGRLVLETPGGLTPEMPFFVRALSRPMFAWLYKMLISPRTIHSVLDECFFDQTEIDDELIEQTYLPLRERDARDALSSTLQQFDETEAMKNLRNVKHETLLLWGIDDRWHDPAMGDQFNVSLHHSHLVKIRNCGHTIHEEKVDRFLEAVEHFLDNGLYSDDEESEAPDSSYFFG